MQILRTILRANATEGEKIAQRKRKREKEIFGANLEATLSLKQTRQIEINNGLWGYKAHLKFVMVILETARSQVIADRLREWNDTHSSYIWVCYMIWRNTRTKYFIIIQCIQNFIDQTKFFQNLYKNDIRYLKIYMLTQVDICYQKLKKRIKNSWFLRHFHVIKD